MGGCEGQLQRGKEAREGARKRGSSGEKTFGEARETREVSAPRPGEAWKGPGLP